MNNSGTVLERRPNVTLEPDFTAQNPINADEMYQLLDGTRMEGKRIIELEVRKRGTNMPFIAYFCPLCNFQLELTGCGFRCGECGAVSEEA